MSDNQGIKSNPETQEQDHSSIPKHKEPDFVFLHYPETTEDQDDHNDQISKSSSSNFQQPKMESARIKKSARIRKPVKAMETIKLCDYSADDSQSSGDAEDLKLQRFKVKSITSGGVSGKGGGGTTTSK